MVGEIRRGQLGRGGGGNKSGRVNNGPKRSQAYDIMVSLVGPQFTRSTVLSVKIRDFCNRVVLCCAGPWYAGGIFSALAYISGWSWLLAVPLAS